MLSAREAFTLVTRGGDRGKECIAIHHDTVLVYHDIYHAGKMFNSQLFLYQPLILCCFLKITTNLEQGWICSRHRKGYITDWWLFHMCSQVIHDTSCGLLWSWAQFSSETFVPGYIWSTSNIGLSEVKWWWQVKLQGTNGEHYYKEE